MVYLLNKQHQTRRNKNNHMSELKLKQSSKTCSLIKGCLGIKLKLKEIKALKSYGPFNVDRTGVTKILKLK